MPGKLAGNDVVEDALNEAVRAPLGTQSKRQSINSTKTCILSTHDEAFHKQDVLVRPDLFTVIPGVRTVLQITSVYEGSAGSPSDPTLDASGHVDPKGGKANEVPEFVFSLHETGQDVLSRLPTLEISLLTPIANALGFRNRTKVIVTEVDEDDYCASHVEIAFKDAYLTRADLWRLLTSDLVGTSIYKNQKVLFINSVKASLKAIYIKGHKVQSALLGGATKAIFRSDSSSYFILLQMSKEMWDFDADGGGEIMFNKVINGFLPELFRRWEVLGTTHTVSVVLFTRMQYEESENAALYRDFYRVVTTELTSGESEAVLQGLKHEFKTFLRDVSITQPEVDENGESIAKDGMLGHGEIKGRPAPAVHGNILEAIHTASLQFLRSNVTCDLRRTGLSLIVITPGTGVFEVSHDLLIRTTDVLIENGIYIDLVCFSRMPLHSSPLFRYKTGRKLKPKTTTHPQGELEPVEEWQYAIPHWVDVSFWEDDSRADIMSSSRETSHVPRSLHLSHHFVPRVRMYEIQMMGIMQNEFSISVPYLLAPVGQDWKGSATSALSVSKAATQNTSDDLEGAKAVYNLGSQEGNSYGSPSKPPPQGHSKDDALSDWIDAHDVDVFSKEANEKFQQEVISAEVPISAQPMEIQEPPKVTHAASVEPSVKPTFQTPALIGITAKRKTSSASIASQSRSLTGKSNPFSRQLSYNFMGFGATKAIATTSVSTNPISVQASVDPTVRELSDTASARNLSSQMTSVDHAFPASATMSRPATRSSTLHTNPSVSGPTTPQVEHISKPIDIRPSATRSRTEDPRKHGELHHEEEGNAPKASDSQFHTSGVRHRKEKSPWMTLLNPSNPKQLTADLTNRLGRWQHVFPRPSQTSTIKWKSLCSPAVLPLTTEDFPTREQLLAECTQSRYVVSVTPGVDGQEDGAETGEWLVRELIGSRLTRGFSVVVGSRPAEALDLPKAQWYDFLLEKGMSKEGVKIIMSRGKEIHELLNHKEGTVEVTRYLHNSLSSRKEGSASEYRPLVRTAYASHYAERQFSFLGSSVPLDWERLDNFVAAREEEGNKPFPESLNYWRARFVLIPIAMSGSRVRHRGTEDSEEEVRLEGIRKLTQMWQKNRYLSACERKFESAVSTKQDANPLDIVYQTRPVSAIVSELNDTILADGQEKQGAQLLPESELFEKAKLNLSALAKAMQGDRGIRLMDRRWHWRLHYYCFIGLEFVSWLVNSFRDIDSRDDAVELGNELMKEGLFVHVEKRHNFRDGNFFYQIAEKYRSPRDQPRTTWLSRLADRSVPATPITETASDDAKGLRAMPSIDSVNSEKPERRIATQPAQKSNVVLSKQLVYDMDHRKKSHRRELVNLHVDKISAVDDCYHLRIDWVTATPKLIEDTVEQWASLAERSGLRLVEVPLLEAHRFRDFHPFRCPYTVKLAKEPPTQLPKALTSGQTDGSRSGANLCWPYHRAILKKFDFVLDLEAASDFPPNVNVEYSWGPPEYKYAQYITRNGRLLAQITDEGHFLLVLNQLFSERGSAAREAQRAAGKEGARSSNANKVFEVHTHGPGGLYHYSASGQPLPTGYANSPMSAGVSASALNSAMSPFASPLLKALGSGSPRYAPNHTNSGTGNGGASKSELMSLLELRHELEMFCNDAEALEKFFEEEINRPPATVPATPLVHPAMSGLGAVAEEGALPSLSLKG